MAETTNPFGGGATGGTGGMFGGGMWGSPQGGIRWMPNLMWGAFFLSLGLAVWYFGKWIGAF